MKNFTTILPRVRVEGWQIIASLLIKYHGGNVKWRIVGEGVLFVRGNCWRGGIVGEAGDCPEGL